MARSSRPLAHAMIIGTIAFALVACSKDSTSSSSRSIVGHVTISQGDARIPSENLVGAHSSARPGALASRRAAESQRITVVFRQEALGTGRLGATSVRTPSACVSAGFASGRRVKTLASIRGPKVTVSAAVGVQ